jgi:hypothetical protein
MYLGFCVAVFVKDGGDKALEKLAPLVTLFVKSPID